MHMFTLQRLLHLKPLVIDHRMANWIIRPSLFVLSFYRKWKPISSIIQRSCFLEWESIFEKTKMICRSSSITWPARDRLMVLCCSIVWHSIDYSRIRTNFGSFLTLDWLDTVGSIACLCLWLQLSQALLGTILQRFQICKT